MSQRAKDLSKRIRSFRDEVIAFVEKLSDEQWNAVSQWEQWTVGVAARHLGAGHLGFHKLLGMAVQGEALPQYTMDQINSLSNDDAKKHADCSKAEALEALRKNGDDFAEFIAGLTDEDLDRKGSMPAFGGEASVEQMLDLVVFQSGRQHLDSMQAAVA
jgi:uncharacterized damage-inducible protein DinB